MEIERKFLIKELPEGYASYPVQHIEQAYLCVSPVVRIRRSNDAYYLTCKGSGLMVREEVELLLTEESYHHLLKKADGNVIAKERYCIPYQTHTIELDVFAPPFAPLIVAEVEFSTEEEALAFQAPEWFGEEVTHDPAYTNAALSRKEW